jgi:hypothetical protein
MQDREHATYSRQGHMLPAGAAASRQHGVSQLSRLFEILKMPEKSESSSKLLL